jgi:uncharacterized membrane protein YjjP (DUF1212 family)
MGRGAVTQIEAERDFLVRFAEAGHEAGYPTADLEGRLVTLAHGFGLAGVQASVTPTVIDLSFGELPQQQSFTLRVRPRAVDLDAIARLDDLLNDVLEKRVDVVEACTTLSEIRRNPLVRPWFVRLGAYALAGAAVAPVVGGGWRDVAAAAFVGFVVGLVVFAAQRRSRTETMVAPVAAIAASFTATAVAYLGVKASPDAVTLAALVTLLPGMTLTIGMRELATEHLQSGVANTANALVQLLGLVFGVGVGRSIAMSWFGGQRQTVPHAAFNGTHLLAAVTAGLAFTVTLRAQTRAAPVMCSATVVAILVNAAGKALLGPAGGVFVASLSIGVIGGIAGGLMHRSPLVFIVPGVLILVPGSAGFNSLLKLLTGETVGGIDAGFNTFVTAMAIAYGLMFSTVVLPRRFLGLGERGAGNA